MLLALFLILLTPLTASGCEKDYLLADQPALSSLPSPSDLPGDRQLVDDGIKKRKIRELQVKPGSYKADLSTDHATAWPSHYRLSYPHSPATSSRAWLDTYSQDIVSSAALRLPPAQAPPA